MKQHPRAMIAMSGGVDSSVAAYLTMQEGFDCIGATMRLLDSTGQDIHDAQAVAQGLGMPFYVFDMTKSFQEAVMTPFAEAYEQGLTPNPCILCNRHLKFGALLEQAIALGCGYVVTGHYARIQSGERYQLYKAVDSAKDQSYFLYSLTQEQLAHIRFPLGELTKEQARQVAQAQGFLNARKRDSQDICFVPDGDYVSFLRQYTGKNYPCGNFLDQNGNMVGQHQGAIAYTLGQRKGLGLAMGQPVYVCGKDMCANTVTVGPNEALFQKNLLAKDWNWISIPEPAAPMRAMAKTRSRMTEQPATIYPEGEGIARIEFDQPQRAITPGQAVVLYQEDMVLGGGTITKVL